MHPKHQLKRWLRYATHDLELQDELNLLQLCQNDGEIYNRFYRELPVYASGMHAPIGAGPNRMNIYTVGRASQAFALCLRSRSNPRPVLVSCDLLASSLRFAHQAACVFAANGIFVWLQQSPVPASFLPGGIRRLACGGGVCITAGYPPDSYCGYLLYGPNGERLPENTCRTVAKKMSGIDPFHGVLTTDFDTACDIGLIRMVRTPALAEPAAHKLATAPMPKRYPPGAEHAQSAH
ncbi:MAG: hypothetical protein AB7V55_07175 [Oscillospiraceae bacterium]